VRAAARISVPALVVRGADVWREIAIWIDRTAPDAHADHDPRSGSQ
jgi:hypothetical protein